MLNNTLNSVLLTARVLTTPRPQKVGDLSATRFLVESEANADQGYKPTRHWVQLLGTNADAVVAANVTGKTLTIAGHIQYDPEQTIFIDSLGQPNGFNQAVLLGNLVRIHEEDAVHKNIVYLQGRVITPDRGSSPEVVEHPTTHKLISRFSIGVDRPRANSERPWTEMHPVQVYNDDATNATSLLGGNYVIITGRWVNARQKATMERSGKIEEFSIDYISADTLVIPLQRERTERPTRAGGIDFGDEELNNDQAATDNANRNTPPENGGEDKGEHEQQSKPKVGRSKAQPPAPVGS